MNTSTTWEPADGELCGSEVAETTYRFASRDLRLVVRRQQKARGEQLSFDVFDGGRVFACITNATDEHSAVEVDYPHRLRGGASEEAIRQLTSYFAMNHAPVQNLFGNWVWWLSAVLAYNVARWLGVLALPESF